MIVSFKGDAVSIQTGVGCKGAEYADCDSADEERRNGEYGQHDDGDTDPAESTSV